MLETRYNTHRVGERIKYLRESSNLYQTELGKALNVTAATISSIERNKSSVSIDLLVKLCKYFNVTADFILSLDDDKLKTSNEIIDLNINPENYINIDSYTKGQLDYIKFTLEMMDKINE